ncbi:MAG: amidase, partial [Acidimicrobiales bacterium]
MTAVDLAEAIRRRDLRSTEVLDAHLRQVRRLDCDLNAVVTLDEDRARERAATIDARLDRGDHVGPLAGLPVAHKDLVDTAGVRTTYGSLAFADHVPARSALLVERMAAAGAVMFGKTNTPELGAGSQTFNEVFGATHNPWDLDRTCGGSSGGAAVALAAGFMPIADGSDMGGSLRNPASFCNVVGLRPSPGRVPADPAERSPSPLAVEGPMARTVGDVALLLSVLAGPEPGSALALDEAGSGLGPPLRREVAGRRVAWSPRLGELPVDPEVTAVLEAHRGVWADLGVDVIEVDPPLGGAAEVFHILRSGLYWTRFGNLLSSHRADIKDTIVWQLEQGRALSADDVERAERDRRRIVAEMAAFMDRFDVIAAPVTQVPPFAIDTTWVREISGVEMSSYIEWMMSCCLISVSALPAVSVPSGFTRDGLPVGLQLVGRPAGERGLLEM